MGAGAKKAIWKPVRFQSIRINMSCCQYARNTDAARPGTALGAGKDNIDTLGLNVRAQNYFIEATEAQMVRCGDICASRFPS